MASFYKTDSDLNLGKEISFFNTSETVGESLVMNQVIISTLLYSPGETLTYLRLLDFLKMWRFYIQYVEKVNSIESTNLFSKGKIPNEAFKITFESDKERENSILLEKHLMILMNLRIMNTKSLIVILGPTILEKLALNKS